MDGLTFLQVKHAKPGRYADGNGLYLHVRSSGSRAWVFRAVVDGKRKDFGLGSLRKVSLAQARSKAASYQASLRFGEEIEPAVVASGQVVPTFAEAAKACHSAIKAGWARVGPVTSAHEHRINR